MESTSSPVGLPGTPYAHWIEVGSTSPTLPEGQLLRLDISTGQVTGGPKLPSASALTVMGKKMAVLEPENGAYELRFAAGAAVSLSAGVKLDWKGLARPLTTGPSPLVRGGTWLPSAHGAELFSVTTGKVLATIGFRAEVSGLEESPGVTSLSVYNVCMARVNVYLPDDLAEQARLAGLNVSKVAQDALRRELAIMATATWVEQVRSLPRLVAPVAHACVLESLDAAREEMGLHHEN